MMLERDLVTTVMRPASEFAMWYAKNEPDEMTKRLYMWRMENQALCSQAENSEDKAAGRIAVEMPTAHRATEFSVDRERVFEYVKSVVGSFRTVLATDFSRFRISRRSSIEPTSISADMQLIITATYAN